MDLRPSSSSYQAYHQPSDMASYQPMTPDFSSLPSLPFSATMTSLNGSSHIQPTNPTFGGNVHSTHGSSILAAIDIRNNGASMAATTTTPSSNSISLPNTTAPQTTDVPTSSSTNENNSNSFSMPPKKRPHSVPEELKDNTYWEKRKKNNDSAKRSRDQRRAKEEQIAMRVVYLEQENLQLRTEVGILKGEIDKLRCLLCNT